MQHLQLFHNYRRASRWLKTSSFTFCWQHHCKDKWSYKHLGFSTKFSSISRWRIITHHEQICMWKGNLLHEVIPKITSKMNNLSMCKILVYWNPCINGRQSIGYNLPNMLAQCIHLALWKRGKYQLLSLLMNHEKVIRKKELIILNTWVLLLQIYHNGGQQIEGGTSVSLAMNLGYSFLL